MMHSKLALDPQSAAAIGLIGCGEQKQTEPPKVEAPKPPPPPPSIRYQIAASRRSPAASAHLGKTTKRVRLRGRGQCGLRSDRRKGRQVLDAGRGDQADPKVGTTVAQKLVDAR